VLKETAVFTLRKEGGAVAGLRWWMPSIIATLANNMLTTDEPDHTRLRGIVDEAFRRRAVLEMEPRIREIADDLAAKLFAAENPADLVARYAQTLPLSVICELLGLPEADRPQFIAWARARAQFTGAIGFLRMIGTIRKMRRYMAGRLHVARQQGGEGLIAELVRVETEGGRISGDEMVSMLFLLLAAGSDTTTHLISGSVYELLKEPERRDWLAQDWSRASLAIEEFLRFVSPVQFSKPRFVRQDISLDGVSLKRGDRVMAMIAAANPILRPTRTPNGSISSGGRNGIFRSAPASISASVISSRASKLHAPCRRCSPAGRSFNWRSGRMKFFGSDGRVCGRSKSCRLRRGRDRRAMILN
jgi:cytochrome P450 PksS